MKPRKTQWNPGKPRKTQENPVKPSKAQLSETKAAEWASRYFLLERQIHRLRRSISRSSSSSSNLSRTDTPSVINWFCYSQPLRAYTRRIGLATFSFSFSNKFPIYVYIYIYIHIFPFEREREEREKEQHLISELIFPPQITIVASGRQREKESAGHASRSVETRLNTRWFNLGATLRM